MAITVGIETNIHFVVSNIDSTSLNNIVTLGTPDTGRIFYPLFMIVEVDGGLSFISVASISLGTNSSSFDNILPITAMTGLSAINKTLVVPLALTVISSLDGSAPIKIKVITAAVGSGITYSVKVIGVYK